MVHLGIPRCWHFLLYKGLNVLCNATEFQHILRVIGRPAPCQDKTGALILAIEGK